MSDTMQCVQITEWGGEPRVTETTVPDVEGGDVLIDVEAASVGRTVANAINGDLGTDPSHLPRVPGHEVVGRIVECGEGVPFFEVGDLVATYTYLACEYCDQCLRARHPLCENLRGFLGVDMDGGYAEYIRIPATNVIPLPEGVDPLEATVVPDAVATPYHVANQRANVEPSDRVMVLGAGGGVGIHLVQVAQHFGGEVTAVDVAGEKLDRCLELGAAHAIDNSRESVADYADEHGIEYDAVVDFTGSTELLEEVAPLVAPRGRVVNLTTFPGRTFDLSPREQVLAEMEVVGSRSFAKYELKRAGELVADGTVEPVISEVVGLDGVADLLARIEAGEVLGRGAVRL